MTIFHICRKLIHNLKIKKKTSQCTRYEHAVDPVIRSSWSLTYRLTEESFERISLSSRYTQIHETLENQRSFYTYTMIFLRRCLCLYNMVSERGPCYSLTREVGRAGWEGGGRRSSQHGAGRPGRESHATCLL